jgi:hypothetical protein
MTPRIPEHSKRVAKTRPGLSSFPLSPAAIPDTSLQLSISPCKRWYHKLIDSGPVGYTQTRLLVLASSYLTGNRDDTHPHPANA